MDSDQFCIDCWKQIKFISDLSCHLCRRPAPYAMGESYVITCQQCLTEPPVYNGLHTVFAYDEVTKPLILRFKHADDLSLARSFGIWMSRAITPVIGDIDIITSVPLHPRRLLKRQYNQSFILSKRISDSIHRPVGSFLIRKTFEKSQKNLSRSQRIKNVSKAFESNQKYIKNAKGKNILLVDDVMTTGATLNACAKILKTNGAKKVYALTLARVFSEKDTLINPLV